MLVWNATKIRFKMDAGKLDNKVVLTIHLFILQFFFFFEQLLCARDCAGWNTEESKGLGFHLMGSEFQGEFP